MGEATEESTGTEEHEHWRTYTYVRGRAKLTDGCCLASEVCVCVCVCVGGWVGGWVGACLHACVRAFVSCGKISNGKNSH